MFVSVNILSIKIGKIFRYGAEGLNQVGLGLIW